MGMKNVKGLVVPAGDDGLDLSGRRPQLDDEDQRGNASKCL